MVAGSAKGQAVARAARLAPRTMMEEAIWTILAVVTVLTLGLES
jgi:hypothetical protein